MLESNIVLIRSRNMPNVKDDTRKERHSANPKSSVHADAKKVYIPSV